MQTEEDKLESALEDLEEERGKVADLTRKLEAVADQFADELGLLTPYAKRKWIEG
jgi:hypothetical protein